MPCAIRVPSAFACSHGSPLHGTNLDGRAAMTAASPSLHETAIAYPRRRPRGSGAAMSRGSGRLTLHARFGYEHWPAMLVRRRRWLDRASGLRRRRPGGCDMGSLGPTHLISLLLAVAIVAATCGFIASAVARRNSGAHAGSSFLASSVDWPDLAGPAERAALPPQCWRLVWKNPVNGRKALYIASHAYAIQGMEIKAARELLAELTETA